MTASHLDLKIAELLCTRLCHDLTGPIGAVNNGAEFLSEEGFNMQHEAVELITTSAASAVARLQFYRSAYGRVKDQGEVNLADKREQAVDYFSGSKITLDWPDSHAESAEVSVGVRLARLMYNLIIVASGVLLKGGTIAVRVENAEEGGKRITITATGPSTKWDAEVERVLKGEIGAEHINPKNVQFFLTQRLAEELGATMAFDVRDGEVKMTVVQPREAIISAAEQDSGDE